MGASSEAENASPVGGGNDGPPANLVDECEHRIHGGGDATDENKDDGDDSGAQRFLVVDKVHVVGEHSLKYFA